MAYDKSFLLPKTDLANKSHKDRFRLIGDNCRNAVAASGVRALSKDMWSEYGKCLKDQWKMVPKKAAKATAAQPKKPRGKKAK